MLIVLDLVEDIHARHVGQVEIEQDQQRASRMRAPLPSAPNRKSSAEVPSLKWHNPVVDAGAADVALDQGGVAFVIFDHDDGNGQADGIRAH